MPESTPKPPDPAATAGDDASAASPVDLARRRLVGLVVYAPPVILGTLLLGRVAAAQTPSCGPAACAPAGCLPVRGCVPSTCGPAR